MSSADTVPSSDRLAEFLDAAHQAARYGLVRCSSGNLSWRIDPDRILITTSRSWMEKLTPDDITMCSMRDGTVLHGGRPSVETEMHVNVLRRRADADVVLHFQSPCATTIACRGEGLPNFAVIPEIPYYIGSIGEVPFLQPGTPELARKVAATVKAHDLVILRNHGQLVVGKTLDDALQKAQFFELACDIILRGGNTIRPLAIKDTAKLVRDGRA